ncbi:nucleoside triphosphate hydrolase [Kumtagia ephedrae]|jgi:pantothenate kinase|uniref:Nucleoside/nucleotide kinase family protein n=1 Tax=Kumtagia ephedrae TaxID=2116701 RepID=A0A2P7S1H4_9HYPH|nr:nucleoside triphosphate hydrolase [Mesorhizobium ephedrae]PSJ56325.1 nucleoside/nucleotide kinase family protein [Mesorhizobium ephedrae]
MSEIATLAATIFKRAGGQSRFVVALAGPPGAGKSTLAENLLGLFPQGSAAVVPMDGFHFDDVVLEARGLRARKGSPETFDFHGFEALLRRIRANESEIAIPVFDRTVELSRAGAAIVGREVKFILVEGNYLLLDEQPWNRLGTLFDLSVYIDVPREELERRLVQRWDGHGKTPQEARAWIESNDMPNIDRVLARQRPADLVLRSEAGRSE